MKHEKSRIAWIIGTAISVIMILVGYAIEEYTCLVKIFGYMILVLSYIQVYIFCRCPYCSYSFLTVCGIEDIRIVVEMPKFCPKCGKEVN